MTRMTTEQWLHRARHAWKVGLPDTNPPTRFVIRVLYTFGLLHSPSYLGRWRS